ncbi:MAG: hypothetical protein IPM97_11385 [Bdellovibrionaceae bacterium]|nr:hypothetical protein [Pseudobdellovibrionaceae bacterium]
MKFIKTLLALMQVFLTLVLSLDFAFAHGEDKPGPHGGYIRMPGAFHTEIVPIDEQKLHVYLLDMNWKNPTTKDSSLVMTFEKRKQFEKAKCQPSSNFYICEFSKEVDLMKSGTLKLLAQRKKKKGNLIRYELPLKHLGKSGNHSGHR